MLKMIPRVLSMLCIALLGCAASVAQAQSQPQPQAIGPAQVQEYADAKNEIDNAVRFQAPKYAKALLKQAQDALAAADGARGNQDTVKFTQFTRLARAHAQLAIASSDLAIEAEKLNEANTALQKAKDELSRLAKPN